ncbi:translation initiation factor IF-2-like [Motacilla alba alba]|uniref:translation initiation factor IF-2-like n=1 Tax=Motacilla alba alba TaxID=1094192 RepID=UPI0018D51C2E|nr:translation initiation factor IF-2-like [Motacilla alba alba]
MQAPTLTQKFTQASRCVVQNCQAAPGRKRTQNPQPTAPGLLHLLGSRDGHTSWQCRRVLPLVPALPARPEQGRGTDTPGTAGLGPGTAGPEPNQPLCLPTPGPRRRTRGGGGIRARRAAPAPPGRSRRRASGASDTSPWDATGTPPDAAAAAAPAQRNASGAGARPAPPRPQGILTHHFSKQLWMFHP